MGKSGYKAIKINGIKYDLHRWLWIQHYGEIPEGYVVHHKNENKLDNRLENLELMKLEDHGRMHNIGKVHVSKEKTPEWYERVKLANEKRRIVGEEGTSYCRHCKEFLPVEMFTKDKNKWNGLNAMCTPCRKIYRSKKSMAL